MRFQSGKEHSGKKRCAVPHSAQELWAERARERERVDVVRPVNQCGYIRAMRERERERERTRGMSRERERERESVQELWAEREKEREREREREPARAMGREREQAVGRER